MNQLEPCPRCKCHVRVSETACPFCGGSIAREMAEVQSRILPSARLGRAALFAFGVSTSVAASTLVGCGDTKRPDVAPDVGGPAAALKATRHDAPAAAIYGGPPSRDADRSDSASSLVEEKMLEKLMEANPELLRVITEGAVLPESELPEPTYAAPDASGPAAARKIRRLPPVPKPARQDDVSEPAPHDRPAAL